MRVSVLLAVVVTSLTLCGGAQAATVTVGSPLSLKFDGTATGEQTVVNLTLDDSGADATSPKDGTVVRWRMAGPYSGGPFRLVVLKPVAAAKYEAVLASNPVTPVPGSGTVTFTTSLPIQAGDTIGLSTNTESSVVGVASGAPGSEFGIFNPPVFPGEPARVLGGRQAGYEMGFNADVEYADPVVAPPPAGPPAPQCVVPSLTGKKLKAVKKALGRANCKLGKVTKRGGATGKTGKVRKQSPKAGKSLTAGSTVAVTLKP